MKKILPALFLAGLFTAFPLTAQKGEGPSQAEIEAFNKEVELIVNKFQYETGTLSLGDHLATLEVPAGYKFLNPEDSRFVLEILWGNPQNPSVLGMLFLKDQAPNSDHFNYAVVYSFSEDGHVTDEDAGTIDYDELLMELQADSENESRELREKGYTGYTVLRWASEPFYDPQSKKLHWAKELFFDDSETSTLNYDVRILGRRGILSMNILGDISILPEVKKDMPQLLASINFNEGHRFIDFNPEVDKLAAYGLGALITGKLLSKTGLFAIVAKYAKFILIGLLAVAFAIKKFVFGSKKKQVSP